MSALNEQANFSEAVLRGGDADYQKEADRIAETYGFDFVGIGLPPFVGAPMKWAYFSGATSQRVTRISLLPGHGIGGIVLKSGQPMMLTDIDQDPGQNEYSSYPIVFAEDLRSFCALPLKQDSRTVGVLILAHRTPGRKYAQTYLRCASDLQGKFLDAEIQEQRFADFGKPATGKKAAGKPYPKRCVPSRSSRSSSRTSRRRGRLDWRRNCTRSHTNRAASTRAYAAIR